MDRWSNQDSDEQRFANGLLRRECSLGCGQVHFFFSSSFFLVRQPSQRQELPRQSSDVADQVRRIPAYHLPA